MANLKVVDADNVARALKATDNGGVLTPHHNVDSLPSDPFGANADAAVVSDTAGTLSGKLRGLIKWAYERMPASLGQKLKAASLPVVIASDQDALAVADGGGSLTVDGTVTVAASENHLGEVGGKIATTSAVPATSTSPAYALGDAIGDILSFTSAVRVSGGSGVISAVIVADKAGQNAAMDLILFSANPGGTTVTDNSGITVADADLLTCIGTVKIVAGDYSSFGDNSVACARPNQPIKITSGTTLYGILVSRGTPTYASVSDLKVTLVISQN